MILPSTSNVISKRKCSVKGSGLLNKVIDSLPIELHLPGYKFCGPGTKLKKRLERGDKGINPLDEACKSHDIAYDQFKDDNRRSIADKLLENRAYQRFKAGTSLGEKIAALGVTAAMKAKRKMGMGMRAKRKMNSKSKTRMGMGLKKKGKGSKNVKRPKRIIPPPKKGGFLPLLFPILGALGALGGGAAGIAKAVNDAKANKEWLAEQKRHDVALEAVKKVANGKGLYLAPFKKNFK